MSLPKVVLFDTPSRLDSDVARMILSYNHATFEVLNLPDEFDFFDCTDASTPATPILEVDGLRFASNTAICRHLAWRYGMSGQTAGEDSFLDMLGDVVQSCRNRLHAWIDRVEFKTQDEREEASDEFCEALVHSFLAPLIERLLRKNSSPWISGHKLTWVDLAVAALFNVVIFHRPHLFISYPNVFLHSTKIAALPEMRGILYSLQTK